MLSLKHSMAVAESNRRRGRAKSLEERFWSKVDKTSTCWLWKGAKDSSGYGWVGNGQHKTITTHRLIWELTFGSIPKGLWVLHTCDVRNCVNPAHLWLGTNTDNQRDASRKGRLRGRAHYHKVVVRSGDN